jgi:hypothetical protein
MAIALLAPGRYEMLEFPWVDSFFEETLIVAVMYLAARHFRR